MNGTKVRPLARLRRLAALGAAACAGFAFAGTGTASAQEFEITHFSADSFDAEGNVETRAGAHPHIAENHIEVSLGPPDSSGAQAPVENIKDVIVDLSPGFGGNPQNVPKCAPQDLMASSLDQVASKCSLSTQVGVMEILLTTGGGTSLKAPVFNMEPPEGVPAQFAFMAASVPIYITASVRPDDHGLRMRILSTSQALPVKGTRLSLWGVPADPAHDMDRGFTSICSITNPSPPPCPSEAPPKAFLSNPTDCASGPPVTRVRLNSWQDPDDWLTATFVGEQLTECDRLEFEPQIDVEPLNERADSPSGYRIELTATNDDNPTGRSTANLKKAVVALPEGTAVNPSAASGLDACSPEEIGLGTDDPISCPDASKIGTVELDSPLQSELMKGGIYLAEQDNNPFGSTLAIYLTPAGGGVQLKLPGEIEPDPVTGRLVTTFDDNPQLPFNSMTLEFKGGSRAVLVNPPTCGTKTVEAEFTPWSASDHEDPAPSEITERTDTFEITDSADGSDCPAELEDRPFEPGFEAGTLGITAGSHTPFVFRLTREDGHQELLSTEVSPPEGVTAQLAGVPVCPPEDAEAGDCDDESKVGRVEVGVGAGATPYFVDAGEAYLAGPFDPDGAGPEPEAPLSLAFEVPAVAGPLDLGTVNVRAAVYVDKTTAQLRVVSEELPTILEGIPLRIRDLRVLIDREEFMLAPTDCTPAQVSGSATSVHGQEASLASHFQVTGCGELPFRPGFSTSVPGKQDLRRNAHPRYTTVLSTRSGDANLDYVRVTLPRGIFLDQGNLSEICTRPQYEQNACPPESRVGHAVADTPLLDDPLEGPVYLRASDNPLPDLVADLDGEVGGGLIEIDLVGKIDQANQRIRTTFDVIPDVPVGTFTLQLEGGQGGLLVNSREMSRNNETMVAMRAKNGARRVRNVPLTVGDPYAQAGRLERKAAKLRAQARRLRHKARAAQGKRAAKLRAKARAKAKRAQALERRAARANAAG